MTPQPRQLWQLFEPLHATLYYAPEAFEEAARLGYRTDERWPSYFAWRAAPLGPAPPELVTATFYSLSPAMIRRYVPAAWRVAAPAEVLRARAAAVDRALRALLADWIGTPELRLAASLLRRAAEAAGADLAGRPMAAAHAALPWPDDEQPHLTLWHAATLLREHRGDGHVAALLAHGLDGTEALVSHCAMGAGPRKQFDSREWTAEQWNAARARLVERGWLAAPDGTITERGRAGRTAVERLTDERAAAPWHHLGPADTGRLARLLAPMVTHVAGTGLLPMESTLGILLTYE